MYLRRALSNALQRSLGAFPAVLVTGPRQSGKTTFLRHEVGERYRYVSFEDPLERDFALTDPNGFLRAFDDSSASTRRLTGSADGSSRARNSSR